MINWEIEEIIFIKNYISYVKQGGFYANELR